MRQPIEHLLLGFLVGVVEGELQLHVRKAVERDRAHDLQVGQAGDLRLDRDRDVAFDLLGRHPRALRDHIDHGRDGIRIGLDVQGAKGGDASGERQDEQDEDGDPVLQRKGENRIHVQGDLARERVPIRRTRNGARGLSMIVGASRREPCSGSRQDRGRLDQDWRLAAMRSMNKLPRVTIFSPGARPSRT